LSRRAQTAPSPSWQRLPRVAAIIADYPIWRNLASIRTVDSLRFLLPYLDKPLLAQETCASIVELAHHRELRLPNEAEFAKALDAVIRICKDPGVVGHAQRYKQNKT
jgi:hypothetical protein